MSVVLALKHYQTLLVRRHVTIVTDNTTVLHLDRFTPVNARQTRLLAFLMQFQLTVKFVRGCRNYTADTLSQLFDEMPSEQKAHFMTDTDDKTDFIVIVSDKKKPDGQNARDTASDRQSAVKPITDMPTQAAVTRSKHADTTLLGADTPNIPAESTLTHGHIASPQAADMLRTTALMEGDEAAEELGTDDASVQVQITCPEITADDYRTDSEFCDMYTQKTPYLNRV